MDNQDPTSPDAWRFFENQSEYENVRESVLPTDGNYSSDGEFTRIAAQEGAALEAQPLKVIKTESEDNADCSNMTQHPVVQVNCNMMKQRHSHTIKGSSHHYLTSEPLSGTGHPLAPINRSPDFWQLLFCASQ